MNVAAEHAGAGQSDFDSAIHGLGCWKVMGLRTWRRDRSSSRLQNGRGGGGTKRCITSTFSRGPPTRCPQRRAYGIGYRCDQPPHLLGGYAEFHYLHPRTTIFKLPDDLPPNP